MRLRQTKSSRGFTLIELVLVMVIAAVVMAIVIPTLSHSVQGRRCGDVAAQMCALAGYARTEAISQGIVYRLNLDAAGRQFYLTMQQGGTFVDLGEEFGRRFELPDDLTMQTDLQPQPDGLYVQFTPDGKCDPATITISDDRRNQVQLACQSATETFHVIDPNTRQ
jgi:type II secretion system protein H